MCEAVNVKKEMYFALLLDRAFMVKEPLLGSGDFGLLCRVR